MYVLSEKRAMSISFILWGIALFAVSWLLGIIAFISIAVSFQRNIVVDRNMNVLPLPPLPPPKPREMIELLDIEDRVSVHVDARMIDRIRLQDQSLFQYVVRRTFIRTGLSIPSNHTEQYDAIMASIPQHELAILIASLDAPIKYNCSFLGEELLQLWIDCSMSMSEIMQGGIMRFAWAKSVAISLASQAFHSKAGIILRMFSDSPHEAHVALQAPSYDEIIDALLVAQYGDRANIGRALEQALDDRTAKRRGYKRFHIVLITDSDKRDIADIADIKERFGTDTFCHVLVIDGGVPALQRIAHTYRVYQ